MKVRGACQRVSPVSEMTVEWGTRLEGVVSDRRLAKTPWMTPFKEEHG